MATIKNKKINKKINKGFSLIELMIAVAIIGILAAIAIPSYQQYLVETRRTDAIAGLSRAAAEQERFFIFDNRYSADINDLGGSATTDGFYTLSLVATDTTFTITAAPVTGSTQASDTPCLSITIDHLGTRLPAACW